MSSILLTLIAIIQIAYSWTYIELAPIPQDLKPIPQDLNVPDDKLKTHNADKVAAKMLQAEKARPAGKFLSQTTTITKEADVQTIGNELAIRETPGLYLFNTIMRWNVQKTVHRINKDYPMEMEWGDISKALHYGYLKLIVVDVLKYVENPDKKDEYLTRKFAEVIINVQKVKHEDYDHWDIDHKNPVRDVKMIDPDMSMDGNIIADALS